MVYTKKSAIKHGLKMLKSISERCFAAITSIKGSTYACVNLKTLCIEISFEPKVVFHCSSPACHLLTEIS